MGWLVILSRTDYVVQAFLQRIKDWLKIGSGEGERLALEGGEGGPLVPWLCTIGIQTTL